jgi:phage shock protein E
MNDVAEMPHKDVPPPLELVKSRIEEMLPPDALAQIASGETVVIDARDPERFEKGHLEGAINISSGESARDAHDEAYAKSVAEAAGGREKSLVVYCGQGNRSARTADALANEHGFKSVASIIGGINLWDDLGYPVEGEVATEADEVESEATMGDDD